MIFPDLKLLHFLRTQLRCPHFFKIVVVFNITSADFVLISGKTTTILKEMRIAQNVQTLGDFVKFFDMLRKPQLYLDIKA